MRESRFQPRAGDHAWAYVQQRLPHHGAAGWSCSSHACERRGWLDGDCSRATSRALCHVHALALYQDHDHVPFRRHAASHRSQMTCHAASALRLNHVHACCQRCSEETTTKHYRGVNTTWLRVVSSQYAPCVSSSLAQQLNINFMARPYSTSHDGPAWPNHL